MTAKVAQGSSIAPFSYAIPNFPVASTGQTILHKSSLHVKKFGKINMQNQSV